MSSDSCALVPIGDLASSERGAFKIGPFGSSLKKSELVDAGVPVLGIENVLPNQLESKARRFISRTKFEDLSDYAIRPGDILITTMGTIGRAAVVPESGVTGIIDSHLFRMRVDLSRIQPRYLAYALNSGDLTRQLAKKSRGAIMDGLNTTILKECVLRVPPLGQQDMVLSTLDATRRLVRMRRYALEMSKGLLGAVFLEMFGDSVRNPMAWPKVALGSLCERITVGHVGPMINEYVPAGIPFLRSLNIRRNKVDLHDVKYVSLDFHRRLRKSALAPGDVVGVRTGMTGVTAVVPAILPVSNCADLIVMTCGKQLEPRFLSEVLNILLGDVEAIAGATGAIQEHFNIGRARELQVPLPPIEIQRTFCRIAMSVQHAIDVAQEALRQAEHLFQTLLHEAFGKGG